MLIFRATSSLLVLLVLSSGCGSRVSDAERRQANNRAQLATSMLMEGELSAALREARRAVDLDPENVDYRITLATIYGARAEFDRAEEQLQMALEIEPDNPFALNNLAAIYINMGRPAEAEEFARRATENESYAGRHLAFYNLGWSMQERQQYPEALEAFAQALRESPRMCLAHYRIGEVYFRMRRFEDAVYHLEQAVAEPDEEERTSSSSERDAPRSCVAMPEAHQVLGLALLAVGRDDDALGAFSQCVELATERSELSIRCAQHLDDHHE